MTTLFTQQPNFSPCYDKPIKNIPAPLLYPFNKLFVSSDAIKLLFIDQKIGADLRVICAQLRCKAAIVRSS